MQINLANDPFGEFVDIRFLAFLDDYYVVGLGIGVLSVIPNQFYIVLTSRVMDKVGSVILLELSEMKELLFFVYSIH